MRRTFPNSMDASAGPVQEAAGDTRLRLHPSCRLVASEYPVDAIWRAHQATDPTFDTLSLSSGAVRLLVHRREDDVGWFHLPPAEAVFIGSLIGSGSLRRALAVTNALGLAFEPKHMLGVLVRDGLVMSAAPSAPPMHRGAPP